MKIGRYEILGRIASGSWAHVYKARRDERSPVVCLKQIREEYSQTPGFVELFLREIDISLRLKHPNVVPVYEYGDDQGPFYVMELVDGWDLKAVLSEHAPLAPTLVACIGLEVAKGLVYIHHRDPATGSKPLVHADISPHNVLISRAGEVKLSDFGIARAVSQSGAETIPTTFRGKRLYASPEQWDGDTISSRTDLFSLGIVLWQALLRGHPYTEELPRNTSMRFDEWVRISVLNNRRRKLEDAAPRAPAGLCKAIEGLLQPLAERTQTAETLLRQLAPLVPEDGAKRLAALVASQQ